MKKIVLFYLCLFCCLQTSISQNLATTNLATATSFDDYPAKIQNGITKAINRATQIEEQVHLSNPTFNMDFTCEGIAISPQKNDLKWAWQLQTINGETVAAVPPQLKDNPQMEYVDYTRGVVTERYLFHQGSVEQLFIIAEQPQGDLNIAGHIQSKGHFEKQSVGWQWTNAQGSIRLGELYVYDAQGKEVAASFTVSSTRTNIHIAAANLAAASYPLTIDPEIGPNDFRISDMGPDGNIGFVAFDPSVAYNATVNNFLVVWHGEDNTGTLVKDENEIFGQLINADGTENGSDFRISDMGPDGDTGFDAFDPSVAYNATANNFLVVWTGDDNTASLVDNEFEIFGQLINADGTEIGPNDFRISDMGPDGNAIFDARESSVSYNSTANNFLVVWQGDDNTGLLVNGEYEIYGQLINADGTENSSDFRISDMGPDGDTNFAGEFPSVAYNTMASNFLVVWSGDDNTAPLVESELEIFGQFINADGTEIGPNDFRISDMGPDGNENFNTFNPSVAYNSIANNFLVVWSGDDDTGMLVDGKLEIFGQLINAGGTEIGPNDFRISDMGPDGDTNFDATESSVAYNSTANNFLVVWSGDDDTGMLVDGELEIFGQLIAIPALTIAQNQDGAEDATDGTFTVTTSEPFDNAITVNFTVGGTATEGTDYANIGTSFLFPANANTATITIDVSADVLVEGIETVTITLQNGTGYIVGTAPNNTASLNITDNDAATLTIAQNQDGAEDATDGTFTVTTSNPFTNATTVNITIGGTATEGTDYANIGTSFMFPANANTATITVDVSGDILTEGVETVIATLVAGTGYTVGAAPNISASLNIVDNDIAPTVSINDPCNCLDPLNRRDALDVITHFHDVLTIEGTAGQSVVLTTGNTNFLDANLSQIADGTTLGTVPLSFDFFHASGASGAITLTVGGVIQPPFSISVCEASTCIIPDPIPTMSQWGTLIFGLLLLNLGIFFIPQVSLLD